MIIIKVFLCYVMLLMSTSKVASLQFIHCGHQVNIGVLIMCLINTPGFDKNPRLPFIIKKVIFC